MNIKQAERILGNRATWELQNMKKALTTFQLFNTPEENERLDAVKVMLKAKGKVRAELKKRERKR